MDIQKHQQQCRKLMMVHGIYNNTWYGLMQVVHSVLLFKEHSDQLLLCTLLGSQSLGLQ